MTCLRLGVLLAVLGATPPSVGAQEPIEAQIAAAVREVDPARIEATVRKLCSFGTRHILSRTDSDTRGTGAARRWLKAEYEAKAASLEETREHLIEEMKEMAAKDRARILAEAEEATARMQRDAELRAQNELDAASARRETSGSSRAERITSRPAARASPSSGR